MLLHALGIQHVDPDLRVEAKAVSLKTNGDSLSETVSDLSPRLTENYRSDAVVEGDPGSCSCRTNGSPGKGEQRAAARPRLTLPFGTR